MTRDFWHWRSLAVALMVLVAAACGGESAVGVTGERDPLVAGFTAEGQKISLSVVDTRLGPALGDGAGYLVYMNLRDGIDNSICIERCVAIWTPLAIGDNIVGTGVNPDLLGSFVRPDTGEDQTTYDGRPLYLFSGDKEPGDEGGIGTGGIWFPISPTGGALTDS